MAATENTVAIEIAAEAIHAQFLRTINNSRTDRWASAPPAVRQSFIAEAAAAFRALDAAGYTIKRKGSR